MESKKIERELIKLQKMYKKLDRKGGPTEAGKFFETVVAFEKSILALYNLKPTNANSKILQSITDYEKFTDWMQIVKYLLATAQNDGTNKNRTPLERLAKGIALSETPGDVIPKMGLSLHDYTIYLYHLIQEGQENIIDIYNDMMKSKGLLEQMSLLKVRYQELKKKNVNFLDRYLQTDLDDDDRQQANRTEEAPIKNVNFLDRYLQTGLDDDDRQQANRTEEVPIAEVPKKSSSDDDSPSVYLGANSSKEMLGNIISIKIKGWEEEESEEEESEEGYIIELLIVPENEIDLYFNSSEDKKIALHPYIYTMTITKDDDGGYSMEPHDGLEDCMDVFHEFEYDDNLNPTLRRRWKTASIADDIVGTLVESNVFGIWNSGATDEMKKL